MTKPNDLERSVGPLLARAMQAKGFTTLTAVQEAVLVPELRGRDLRISSQTGSGKTVAIGLALRDALADLEATEGKAARPRALVIAPTRELAKQVEEELAWLFAPLRAHITSVTGGAGYRGELRALRSAPAVVVGTPGRLLDHLGRGSIDASSVQAVVLDEADRMLDMGFREDLEAILGHTSEERRTHLVSATFPREVKRLADRVQREPAHVEGTPLGAANVDIDHVVHLVRPEDRFGAIVNLLLSTPGAQTLVFARTRADVAELGAALADADFDVATLSGEMEQGERNRALAAFKTGRLDGLIATDVAARGIDVQDIARVIHADPPEDADAYTHRSGRTGRAGKKGTSAMLVAPGALRRVSNVLERARVAFRIEPLPTASELRGAREERLFVELTSESGDEPDAASWHIAKRIAEAGHTTLALARLVSRIKSQRHPEPREVASIPPPEIRTWSRTTSPQATRQDPAGWVSFRVSWGQTHGADVRRLLAMVCRRGRIDGRDVGAIRVAPTFSVVDIAANVAPAFERATREPDPRNPKVAIRRWEGEPPSPKRKSAPKKAGRHRR